MPGGCSFYLCFWGGGFIENLKAGDKNGNKVDSVVRPQNIPLNGRGHFSFCEYSADVCCINDVSKNPEPYFDSHMNNNGPDQTCVIFFKSPINNKINAEKIDKNNSRGKAKHSSIEHPCPATKKCGPVPLNESRAITKLVVVIHIIVAFVKGWASPFVRPFDSIIKIFASKLTHGYDYCFLQDYLKKVNFALFSYHTVDYFLAEGSKFACQNK